MLIISFNVTYVTILNINILQIILFVLKAVNLHAI